MITDEEHAEAIDATRDMESVADYLLECIEDNKKSIRTLLVDLQEAKGLIELLTQTTKLQDETIDELQATIDFYESRDD